MFHNFPVLRRSEVFVLAVDVDLTLVDSLTSWLEYYNSNQGSSFTMHDLPEPEPDEIIDLVPWFKERGISDPLEYWKGDIYSQFYGHTVNVSFRHFLRKLVFQLGNATGKVVETIVVSSCFPEHENSKRDLVRRVFRAETPFISTSAKHMVDFDLIIDDSLGVAFNCLMAGKNVLHAPSPLAKPSKGTLLHPQFFHPGYDGKSWPYDWSAVPVEDLVADLLANSNK